MTRPKPGSLRAGKALKNRKHATPPSYPPRLLNFTFSLHRHEPGSTRTSSDPTDHRDRDQCPRVDTTVCIQEPGCNISAKPLISRVGLRLQSRQVRVGNHGGPATVLPGFVCDSPRIRSEATETWLGNCLERHAPGLQVRIRNHGGPAIRLPPFVPGSQLLSNLNGPEFEANLGRVGRNLRAACMGSSCVWS